MVIFCVLWIPLCYYFWRSIRPENYDSGDIWAVLTGCLAVFIRFLVPNFIDAEGFGISRWLNAFIDFAAVPVIFPVIAAFILSKIKFTSGFNDLCGFIMVELVPVSLVRSIVWSAQHDPIRLVLTPVLWSFLAFCLFPLALGIFGKNLKLKIPAILGLPAALFLAASIWWKFFCQEILLAYTLLLPLFACAAITVIYRCRHKPSAVADVS